MHSADRRQQEFVGTPRQYFDLLGPAFAAAAPEPVDAWFRFGTRVVRVRFATEALRDLLSSGIQHLRVPASAVPELTLNVWDSATSGAPPLPAPATTHLPAANTRTTDIHCDYGCIEERYQFCFSYTGSGIKYNFLDHATREAHYWTPDCSDLPAYELAAPFRLTLHWWLRSAGSYLIHGGVVGTEHGGVLIGGRGGSGKSTTCLTCASAGLDYASDDYVAVSSEPDPIAYSLYCSVKLTDDSLQRFPQLNSLVVNPTRQADDKAIAFLTDDSAPKFRVVTELPLVAIVLPRITAVARPRMTRARAIQALQALGPSTMVQMPGTTQAEFKVVAELARKLPTYQLDLAPDMSLVPELLRDLIQKLG